MIKSGDCAFKSHQGQRISRTLYGPSFPSRANVQKGNEGEGSKNFSLLQLKLGRMLFVPLESSTVHFKSKVIEHYGR